MTEEEENWWVGGQSAQKIYGTIPFHVRETPFLKREGTAKRALLLLLKRAGGLESQETSPSSVPALSLLI